MGNNHITNFGEEGVASTREYLDKAGVAYFGGVHGDEPVYHTDTNLSFVSYNQFGGNSPDEVAYIIQKEKEQGKTVIVYAHWGEEYTTTPSGIRDVAKLFAASGADVIIGSHPHVVMPYEHIGKTIVYYSLGNFIFDQYFSKDVRHGLAVELILKDGKITTKEYPLELELDGRTCPLVTENSSK
jgi:poly-gamma-glutamate synthesis protein (capsule biosynthesis protein)